jgi:hypothetical protein
VREAAIFGLHGGHVNVTDGRYVYMRGAARADNDPLYEYTLMPTRMRGRFDAAELRHQVELSNPFAFTKGCRTMKIRTAARWTPYRLAENLLFDLQHDPKQQRCLDDAEIESSMIEHLVRLMVDTDAPPEQYERLGLDRGRVSP